jgi:hypothetical protein
MSVVFTWLLCGGSEWESNPPSPSEITIYGFEDRESHRTPCASSLIPFDTSEELARLESWAQDGRGAGRKQGGREVKR